MNYITLSYSRQPFSLTAHLPQPEASGKQCAFTSSWSVTWSRPVSATPGGHTSSWTAPCIAAAVLRWQGYQRRLPLDGTIFPYIDILDICHPVNLFAPAARRATRENRFLWVLIRWCLVPLRLQLLPFTSPSLHGEAASGQRHGWEGLPAQ